MTNRFTLDITQLCGASLVAIKGAYHSMATQNLLNPLSVCLQFEGCAISIRGSADGEGVTVEAGCIEEAADLGELGSILAKDLSSLVELRDLIGAQVVAADEIQDEAPGGDLGLSLSFKGCDLVIVNLGDELFLKRRRSSSSE